MTLSNKTFIPTKDIKNFNSFIIDCKGKKLGRLSTFVTALLKGKLKTEYYPSISNTDNIILINTDLILFNSINKQYLVYNPGRPGHSLKIKKNKDCLSTLVIRQAIKGMLSKKEKKKVMRRLKVFKDENHPYSYNILKEIDLI